MATRPLARLAVLSPKVVANSGSRGEQVEPTGHGYGGESRAGRADGDV